MRFKDDNTYNPHWPAGSPPDVMNNYIDPNSNTNSTNYFNLTHYFDEISIGTYDVIGEAVYVETPHNKSYYGSPTPSRSMANKDVLQNAVDPLVNFSDYDNWSFNSNYSHTNQPDGTVDMIIMVWRGLVFGDWGGEASLGYGNSYTVENGTKTIKNSFGGNSGSGFTAHDWEERNEKYNFHIVLHEFSHWLLGGNHPYSDGYPYQPDEHAYWGLLHHSSDGLCANAYERERLAWINPTEITSDIINAPLNDYLETGVAYKYHPTNGATNEYYYFENHQKLNIYDDATENSNDRGIFVLHFKDAYNGANDSRLKTADGQFNWSSNSIASCFGGTNNVRQWEITSVNRAGNNRRDKLNYNGTWDWIWSIEGGGCAGYPYGGNSSNAFNLTYNDVFSPKSNPYSATWGNVEESFTMEVFDKNGSVLNVRFYLTNPYDGKPSKPQNLQLAQDGNSHPVLSWDANLEPDLNGYRVYKKLTLSGGSSNTSYVFTTSTSYTDNDFEIDTKFGSDQAEYWIVAVDDDNKLSIESEHRSTKGDSFIQWKLAEENNDDDVIKNYALNQNYPNPFNPTTQLAYQIKESGHVRLIIYNTLGQKVATLVNEVKAKGKYSINFNAENLPSGVYIYSLQVNDFVQNQKMALVK